MLKTVSEVLLTECIIERGKGVAEKDAGPVNLEPFQSILGEDPHKIHASNGLFDGHFSVVHGLSEPHRLVVEVLVGVVDDNSLFNIFVLFIFFSVDKNLS